MYLHLVWACNSVSLGTIFLNARMTNALLNPFKAVINSEFQFTSFLKLNFTMVQFPPCLPFTRSIFPPFHLSIIASNPPLCQSRNQVRMTWSVCLSCPAPPSSVARRNTCRSSKETAFEHLKDQI